MVGVLIYIPDALFVQLQGMANIESVRLNKKVSASKIAANLVKEKLNEMQSVPA